LEVVAFVINLDRRADRLAYMQDQLDRLGIVWHRVSANDMQNVDRQRLRQEVAETGHIRTMGMGSQCCALTTFDIFRHILKTEIHFALILQDDVELSPDLKAFLTSLDWLPEEVDLVQFEKYGRPHSKRLLGPPLGTPPVPGRRLRRLHSRTGGAACCLIKREAVQLIMERKPLLRMPIDHFLFSPNISPVFKHLRVAVVTPALARQREDGFESDLDPERSNRTKSVLRRLRRLWQEVNCLPSQLFLWIGGARWHPFGFKR